MSKYIVGFLIGLAGFHTLSAQSQWYWQNPMPSGNFFTDVFFVNDQTGFVTGPRGFFSRTTDGGTTWESPDSLSDRDLNAIYFFNTLEGFVAGDNRIYHTLDGGATWTERFHSEDTLFSSEDYFQSLSFGDADHGIAVAYLGEMLRTTDRGRTWEVMPPLPDDPTLSTVHMRNGQTGIAGGLGSFTHNYSLYRTTDGGDTWTPSVIIGKGETTYIGVNDVAYLGNSVWVAVGTPGVILRSTDDGQSWEKIRRDSDAFSLSFFSSVSFRDEHYGITVGGGGKYFVTEDGGWTWNESNIGTIQNLFSVQLLPNGSGFIAGAVNTLLKFSGNGPWTTMIKGYAQPILDITWLASDRAIAVGDYGAVLHTTDAGQHWVNSRLTTSRHVQAVSASGISQAVAVGDSGLIARSGDGGKTWTFTGALTDRTLYGVDLLDAQNALAVGQSGKILQTTDGGVSWIHRPVNTLLTLYDVQWLNARKAWAVGSRGQLIRTVDRGETWQAVASPTIKDLRAVDFADSLHGLAVGMDGAIVRTVNGGDSWESVPVILTDGLGRTITIENYFFDVQFITPTEALVMGERGSAYRSVDTGRTWSGDSLFMARYFHDVYAVDFLNDSTGMAVGQHGNILAYLPKTLSHRPYEPIPETIFLSQNYPNPFNPTTRIPYGLDRPAPVSIRIYNILGQEVTTLLHTPQHPAGNFSITWDGKDRRGHTVASGVYFYTLHSGKIIKTRKLIYVK